MGSEVIPHEVSSELQLELGLDLELNTEDVAAAEAAVAAHIDESLMCSCCTQVLTDKASLHLHQISRHSLSELSLALLSIRGLNVKSGQDVIEQQDLCCQNDDSDSTASANSAFMCGLMDDFCNNSSQNMVDDIGVSSPSALDLKFNNNVSYTPSVPASQYSTDDAQKTGHEACVNGSLLPNAPSSTGQQGQVLLQGYRRAAWATQQILSEVKTAANRKDKNRAESVKAIKESNKCPTEAKDKVIDLTAASKNLRLVIAKPSTRVNKEWKCGDGNGNNGVLEERKFSCDICGRRYKKKSHLGRHARMHSGVRPFSCTVCDKRFAVRSILKQHLRVHTGERPFNCLYCLQRFPQKSGLVTHMMLHTGKPYKCDCCAKSFVSNHKLVVHKRAHDEQSGRLPSLGPYSCPSCATRFFTSSALWEHCKVHSTATSNTNTGTGTSSLTTAKSSDNSINCKVSATAPAECSVAQHLTGTLEFIQDISPERDDGKKSESGRNISRSSLENGLDVEANTRNSQEVTASQALLTLMDSKSECVGSKSESHVSEQDFGDEDPLSSHEFGDEDPLSSHEFEFCDLKSSIELKEECFDFVSDNLDVQYKNKIQRIVH